MRSAPVDVAFFFFFLFFFFFSLLLLVYHPDIKVFSVQEVLTAHEVPGFLSLLALEYKKAYNVFNQEAGRRKKDLRNA